MSTSIIEENEEFLLQYQGDLQSNIFSPHKKDHTLLLFLNFNETPEHLDVLVRILKSFGNNVSNRQGLYISSTEIAREKRLLPELEQDLYFNIYLSKEGLSLLGYQEYGWEKIKKRILNACYPWLGLKLPILNSGKYIVNNTIQNKQKDSL